VGVGVISGPRPSHTYVAAASVVSEVLCAPVRDMIAVGRWKAGLVYSLGKHMYDLVQSHRTWKGQDAGRLAECMDSERETYTWCEFSGGTF